MTSLTGAQLATEATFHGKFVFIFNLFSKPYVKKGKKKEVDQKSKGKERNWETKLIKFTLLHFS